jgi:hypothetical protein
MTTEKGKNKSRVREREREREKGRITREVTSMNPERILNENQKKK